LHGIPLIQLDPIYPHYAQIKATCQSNVSVSEQLGRAWADHFKVAMGKSVIAFGCRDVSDRPKQPAAVEPIDPAEGGYFQILHIAHRVFAMNEFGFAETVNRLGEAIVP